ncbi:MAG: DUF4342 domain-containing protein [Spirochaetales bacterium]|nr:DUF4342 domain-containing protein [Spirochaetales bacterium]
MAEKDWIQEVRIRGEEAVQRVKELVRDGNVRKVVVKKEDGEILFEIPLTVGALAGGAVALAAPLLAALGAATVFLAHITLEIHRVDDDSENDDS